MACLKVQPKVIDIVESLVVAHNATQNTPYEVVNISMLIYQNVNKATST